MTRCPTYMVLLFSLLVALAGKANTPTPSEFFGAQTLSSTSSGFLFNDVTMSLPLDSSSIFDESPTTENWGGGWKKNLLLGFFYDAEFPFVYSLEIGGWLYINGLSELGYHFWSYPDSSWAFTSSELYPYFFVFSGEQSGNWVSSITLTERPQPAAEGYADATIVWSGSLPRSRTIHTSFHNNRDQSDGANYSSSIWSSEDHIYVALNARNELSGSASELLLTEVAQLCVASGMELARERIHDDIWDYSPRDTWGGHSGTPLAVDSDGYVYARRSGHLPGPVAATRTTTPEDLSTFETLAEPTLAGEPYIHSYRRFFRDPEGRVWLWTRSRWGAWSEGYGILRRFDPNEGNFVNVAGPGETPTQFTHGAPSYSWHMDWDSQGRIWGVSSNFRPGELGFHYPNRGTATAGWSEDHGATWTNFDGVAISGVGTPSGHGHVAPFSLDSGTFVFPKDYFMVQVAVAYGDRPVFVAGWVGPEGDRRLYHEQMRIWVKQYDPDSGNWASRRLNVARHADAVLALPDGGLAITSALQTNSRRHLFVTFPGEDFLDVWYAWDLDTFNRTFGYFDPNAPAAHGVIRILSIQHMDFGYGTEIIETPLPRGPKSR